MKKIWLFALILIPFLGQAAVPTPKAPAKASTPPQAQKTIKITNKPKPKSSDASKPSTPENVPTNTPAVEEPVTQLFVNGMAQGRGGDLRMYTIDTSGFDSYQSLNSDSSGVSVELSQQRSLHFNEPVAVYHPLEKKTYVFAQNGNDRLVVFYRKNSGQPWQKTGNALQLGNTAIRGAPVPIYNATLGNIEIFAINDTNPSQILHYYYDTKGDGFGPKLDGHEHILGVYNDEELVDLFGVFNKTNGNVELFGFLADGVILAHCYWDSKGEGWGTNGHCGTIGDTDDQGMALAAGTICKGCLRGVAIANPNGNIEVFAPALAEGLRHYYWDAKEESWGSNGHEHYIGGFEIKAFLGLSAVVNGNGNIEVFGIGMDDRLLHWFWDAKGEGWGDNGHQEVIGNFQAVSRPAATFDKATKHVNVYATGTDGAIIHWFWDGQGDGWGENGHEKNITPKFTTEFLKGLPKAFPYEVLNISALYNEQ